MLDIALDSTSFIALLPQTVAKLYPCETRGERKHGWVSRAVWGADWLAAAAGQGQSPSLEQ